MKGILIWMAIGIISGIIVLIHDYFVYRKNVTISDLRLMALSAMLGPITFACIIVIFYKAYEDKVIFKSKD